MIPAGPGLSGKGYEGQDYEGFWIGAGKRYLDELERAIATDALPGGDAIVEIGAGFGRLGRCYIERYRRVHMVEPASNLRDLAAQAYGSAASYHEASVFNLPFANESFDAALMVRVFHHLGDAEGALREIYRVLKRGGRLVFNYSNKRNGARIARYLLGRGDNPFTHGAEQYHEALFGHHPADVERMVARTGFAIRAQYGVGVTDKLVEWAEWVGRLIPPSVRRARVIGPLRLAPAQFIVAEKR